ncbi:DNA polymerase III subunit alpha [Paenibacillus illinoisensis]|uniref:DNA polymerase III subunit alpha n=1 Tax=Paenibacillus illinoisensis TaxID=59845 RepID=UPI00301B0587
MSQFKVLDNACGYVNLHLHTDASHLDGLNDIPRLMKRLKEIGHNACAITDHGNMHNVLKFYRACIENDIKPILGFEAYVSHNHTLQSKSDIEAEVERTGDDFVRLQNHLVLLAKDNEGYKNLLKLTTLGFTDGFYKKPTIDFDLLKKHSKGVIAIEGHVGTAVARAAERMCNPVSLLEKQIMFLFDFKSSAELEKELTENPELYCNDKHLSALMEPYDGATIDEVIAEQKAEYAKKERIRANELVQQYKEVFGDDFYLEVQYHDLSIEEQVSPVVVELAETYDIPLVMTNDSHYTWRTDAEPHRIHMSNGIGKTLSEFMNSDFEGFKDCDEFYVKSDEEMFEMASALEEYIAPGTAFQALLNTLKVADKCNVTIDALVYERKESEDKVKHSWGPKEYLFPDFPVPAPYASIEEYFKRLVKDGIEERKQNKELLGLEWGMASFEEYIERMEYEVSVILNMGFPTYFLILWDAVRFCRENDIPVGKGRGSGAGSLVLYSLRITDIDPMPYSLIFERFLNPSRISLPDVDMDFDYDRIEEVIDYIKEKYGHEYVAKIGTFGTLGAKAVMKDVARVLDYPFDKINAMTRQVQDIGITIEKIMESYPEFANAYDVEPEFRRIIDVSKRLEGLQRHTSQHAAGLLISPIPLTEIAALKGDHGDLTSQWEMGDVELIGLVKMDFLKLRTLSVVKNTLNSIERHTGEVLDIDKIPLDDEATYAEFHKGNSLGVFQFESPGMQALLKKNKPNSIEDLTALNALYRPGPLDMKVTDENSPHYGKTMVDIYSERASGQAPVEYDHPLLEQVLGNTFGVFVYQEQVMNGSVVLAGFTLPESDELRKIVGKKLLDKMPAQHDKFIRGCLSNPEFVAGSGDQKAEDVAEHIWKQIETFARYGFNKAHACAYADLAYRSMYLKVHYPVHFMASVLTSWMGGKIEEMVPYLNECRRMDIGILAPDVNHSSSKFEPSVDQTGIHFGLTGIKGVGAKAVANILEVKINHAINSLIDFMTLTGSSVNKTVVSSLIKAGAFDFLGLNRRTLLQTAEDLIAINSKIKQRITSNAKRKAPVADISVFYQPLWDYKAPSLPEFSPRELCDMEKELTGFYMAHHPLDGFVEYIRSKSTYTSLEINKGVLMNGYDLETDEQFRYLYSQELDPTEPMYRPLPAGQTVITGGVVKQLKAIPIKSGRSKGKEMATFILEDAYQGDIKCTIFAEGYSRFRNTIREGNVIFIKGKVDYYRENAQVNVNEAKEISPDVASRYEPARDIEKELQEVQELIELAEETIEVIGFDNADMISAVCEELLSLYDKRDELHKLTNKEAVA